MKIWHWIILLTIVFVVIRLGLAQKLRHGWPDLVEGFGRGLKRLRAGLTDKRIQASDHRVAYLEGGKGPAVVLLHDFGGTKDDWTTFSRFLPRGFRVVAPDLPGFGESERTAGARYDVMSQVRRLRGLLVKLHVNKVHLVGCGVGGAMAGIYAGLFARAVSSLTLIEPFGIESESKTEIQGLTERGWSPMTAATPRDLERIRKTLYVQAPKLSKAAAKRKLDRMREDRDFHSEVWKDLWKFRPYLLESVLPEIKAPTLIISGDTNRVFHQSCAKKLHQGITGSNVSFMKGVGHWPMVERTKETAQLVAKNLG